MSEYDSVKTGINRREILASGIVAAAGLVLPARAFAQALETSTPAAIAPTAPVIVPAAPAVNVAAPSHQRLIEIAKQQIERHGNKIWLRDKAGIVDFSAYSSTPRFHIVDFESGKIRSLLCTHGRGSDPENEGWLKNFSNDHGSAATSRGAYVTRLWYQGKHGLSMRLLGLEADNSNAEDRAIVVHGAWYAEPRMITEYGKLGRSEGCFAFPEARLPEVVAHLGPGRLLFADRLL
jgi:hypothetical protein